MTVGSYSTTENTVCKPLRTFQEILEFVANPPEWHHLCRPLTLHSPQVIKNIDLTSAKEPHSVSLEQPESFCHFNLENDEVQRYDEKTLPKTMVCHDSATCYKDDAYVDGSGDDVNYVFYNWAGIDIFCYYSHNLITVPPLGWINVGHAHGVKVLGTVTTETSAGAAFWEYVLKSQEDMESLIRNLVQITKILNFEGWLLQIENKISEPMVLLEFVRTLHAELHREVPYAVLIWYDSVTLDGRLKWQNKLNEKNRAYFDACDGIFINFSWSKEDIDDTLEAAGERRQDVFIGINIWGNNFFGGGMFNTQEALQYLYPKACSIALLSPSWTFEVLLDNQADENDPHAVVDGQDLSLYQRFLLRDHALWGSIWPFLNTHVPSVMPFHTSFCCGHGKRRRLYGEVLCNTPWYNLRHQQYQPNSAHGPHGYILSTAERIRIASRYAMSTFKGNLKLRKSLAALHSDENDAKAKILQDEEPRELKIKEDDTKDNETKIKDTEKKKEDDTKANETKIKDTEKKKSYRCKRTSEVLNTAHGSNTSLYNSSHPSENDRVTLFEKFKIALFKVFGSNKKTTNNQEPKANTSSAAVSHKKPTVNTEQKRKSEPVKISEQERDTEETEDSAKSAVFHDKDENLAGSTKINTNDTKKTTELVQDTSKYVRNTKEYIELEKYKDDIYKDSEIQNESSTSEITETEKNNTGINNINDSNEALKTAEMKHDLTKKPNETIVSAKKAVIEENDDKVDNSETSLSMIQQSVFLWLGKFTHHEKTRLKVAYVSEEHECLTEYEDDAFLGGTCLAIYPSDEVTEEHRTVRILHCDFQSANSLVICMVTKHMIAYQTQYLNLVLQAMDAGGSHRFVLIGRFMDGFKDPTGVTVLPVVPGTPAFYELKKYLLLHVPNFYVPVENSYGWMVL